MRVGDVLADRYELQDLLGVGGMASVFRAHDRVLERTVALKVLAERYSNDPEYVERFRREAQAIARLSHPNIVTIIDRGETDGCQYIVFEHVRGPNLKEVLREQRRLPIRRALEVAHQAARGLAFAHEHGVVHRDVKPQNILLDEDGDAKVTDFGIARSAALDDGLTQSGVVLGTSDYIAPEQATGARVDARSDQYSLGVLLFELLTGETPYRGASMVEVAMRHLQDPVPSPRERRPDMPPRVDGLVRRAMAKRPDDRFPSLDAFMAAIEAAMVEEAVPDPGATQVLRPARPRRRRRRLPLALMAGLLVAAAAALVVWALATGRFVPGEEDAGGRAPIRLMAVDDYDPPPDGDGVEHPELLAAATDGDPVTWWRTETYDNFQARKDGVGILLEARQRRALSQLVVVTDTPGYRAMIQAGNTTEGGFVDVSDERTVDERTVFELDGGPYRYYVVWITDLEEVAHVNEVSGRG